MRHLWWWSFVPPAPVLELVAPAPVISYAALAPVVEYVAPAPAVAHAALAPLVEFVAPAPVETYDAPTWWSIMLLRLPGPTLRKT